MKSRTNQATATAIGVMLTMVASIAQADVFPSQQPLTTAGARPNAEFRAGATINGQASFLSEVPAADAFDFVATIIPAPEDVGRTGALVAVATSPGLGIFNMLPDGSWIEVNLVDLQLQAFRTKVLEAEERVTIVQGLVGEQLGLAGRTLSIYVGYYTGSDPLATLTYSGTPGEVAIAAAPSPGCPANTTAATADFQGKPVCVLRGRITSDVHLTANNSYLLDGAVFIGANERSGEKTRLTIDSGTTVFSTIGLNFLVIDRNGQIFANGSRARPIIFTYEGDAEATANTTGQWGGLIINGNARLNVAGGEAEGEGSTGTYGGPDDSDSSGALTYVQVKYAGQNITPENELNGIAFQGTGSGTIVDYVQVHNNSDDGIEFFGGATNARHILLTGNEDDALDWTFGWRGKVQFIAMRQNTVSEHCIEADNNSDNNDAEPRANPVISNVTCAGDEEAGSESGFRLREGTSAALSNVVMSNFNDYCVDIDQTATFIAAGGSIGGLNGSLAMTNSRVSADCPFEDGEDGDLFPVSDWFRAQPGSAAGGVDLGGNRGLVNGNLLNGVAPAVPADPFFEQVDHIGAIRDAASDWTRGWSF